MGEVLLRHEVVRLDGTLDVLAVDTNSDTHEHVLGSLGDLAVDAEEVGTLERLEAEEVVVEVALVDDGRVELVLVLHDDLVGGVRDHGAVTAILGVDVLVERLTTWLKFLLVSLCRLLMAIRAARTA